MKVTSIIFDWDGTLAMTLHLWLAGYRQHLQDLGYDFSDQAIVADFFTEHEKGSLKHPGIDFKMLFNGVYDYMNANLARLTVYSQARATLEKLQASGVILTLVSSSPRKLLDEGLRITELTPFFATTLSGDEVTCHKPHPEAFQRVMALQKFDPSTTLILGDSPADILAARAAGLTSCLFLPTENNLFYDFRALKKNNPDYYAETLRGFAELVIGRALK
jgi:pyrophosphatase PpaX